MHRSVNRNLKQKYKSFIWKIVWLTLDILSTEYFDFVQRANLAFVDP